MGALTQVSCLSKCAVLAVATRVQLLRPQDSMRDDKWCCSLRWSCCVVAHHSPWHACGSVAVRAAQTARMLWLWPEHDAAVLCLPVSNITFTWHVVITPAAMHMLFALCAGLWGLLHTRPHQTIPRCTDFASQAETFIPLQCVALRLRCWRFWRSRACALLLHGTSSTRTSTIGRSSTVQTRWWHRYWEGRKR